MNHQTPEQIPRDAVEQLLAEAGCPYPAGSADSVIWLQGRLAGVAEAVAMVRRLLGGASGDLDALIEKARREQ